MQRIKTEPDWVALTQHSQYHPNTGSYICQGCDHIGNDPVGCPATSCTGALLCESCVDSQGGFHCEAAWEARCPGCDEAPELERNFVYIFACACWEDTQGQPYGAGRTITEAFARWTDAVEDWRDSHEPVAVAS